MFNDQIALYLNLATTKTRGAGGSLSWLTGNEEPRIEVGHSTSQETQCMVIGSSIWIANNEDVDTDFQLLFLNRIGVDSYPKLKAHVEANSIRLLPSHAGRINVVGGSRPGEKLMARLTGTENRTPALADGFAMPVQQAACQSYSLSSVNAPPASGIVFVKGSYQGAGGENEHAEQKLLAAFGHYLRGYGTSLYSKTLDVSGCKSACSTCRGVLEAVRERLRQAPSRNRVFFDEPDMVNHRGEVGMGAAHPHGIKALDVDHYFPN
ncbi:hypothetical protein ACH50O_10880 [Methylomonas sp. 2BW1-5-20]|uniref:hypothetical protein n=1 Tax=Methylomonas sp. 2BW1-5-20 TaxID=3376686 RepID=UPI0040524AEC